MSFLTMRKAAFVMTVVTTISMGIAIRVNAGPSTARAIAMGDFAAVCEIELKKTLSDPATFELNRRRSEMPAGDDGMFFWMFYFDAATRQGNAGHFTGYCKQNADKTVTITYRLPQISTACSSVRF